MNNYSLAYSEVLEVLKYLPKEDYDKIPSKTIDLLEANCDENSDFTYNIALPFDKQNISKDAKNILALLYRTCWISEEEKKKITLKEKAKLEKDEKLKKEKYNPDNIFKNNKRQEYAKENSKLNHINALAEIKKETLFDKTITFFKKLFKIN